MPRSETPRKTDFMFGRGRRESRECTMGKGNNVETDTERTYILIEPKLDNEGRGPMLESLLKGVKTLNMQ